MENNITLVSSPDSFVEGDLRILLGGVSDAWILDIINYFSTQPHHTVIHSITNEDYEWIFRTAQTCDIILLDLENYNGIGAGWLLKEKATRWYGNVNLTILEHKKIFNPLNYIVEYNKEMF